MLLGFALLYVGAVLFLNGLWLMGKIDDKEIVVINVVSGFVTLCVALASAFGTAADAASVKSAALTLLFTTTAPRFWLPKARKYVALIPIPISDPYFMPPAMFLHSRM